MQKKLSIFQHYSTKEESNITNAFDYVASKYSFNYQGKSIFKRDSMRDNTGLSP